MESFCSSLFRWDNAGESVLWIFCEKIRTEEESGKTLSFWRIGMSEIQMDRALYLLIRENFENEFPGVEPVTLQSHCWEAERTCVIQSENNLK